MKKTLLMMSALVFAGASYAQHSASTGGQKHVMLYEGSGAWCQHCSDGAIFVEKNLTKFGEKLVAISVHNRDGMSTADGNILDASLAAGWPWGSVDMEYFNALKLQYIPSKPQDTANISLNRGLWELAITERLALPPKFDLMMEHSFDKASRELTVSIEVTALVDAPGNFNVNVFLTEDKVVGPDNNNYNQANANSYNTNSAHPLYNKNNNAAKTKIVGWEHNHTVRASLGGPWGVSGPSNAKKGDVFKHEFKYTIPVKMGFTSTDELTVDLNNMHLAAVIHGEVSGPPGPVKNPKGAQADNALGTKMYPWDPNDVESLNQVAQVQVFPNPASTSFMMKAYLNEPSDATLTIMNLVGQTYVTKTYSKDSNVISDIISTDNMSNGIYMVTITTAGGSLTHKLVVNK